MTRTDLTWNIEVSDVNRLAMVARDADGQRVSWEELGRLDGLSLREACAASRGAVAMVDDFFNAKQESGR